MTKHTPIEWEAKMKELEMQGLLSPKAAELAAGMLEDLRALESQNGNLRRAALKASRQDRMSTKLKEALYE